MIACFSVKSPNKTKELGLGPTHHLIESSGCRTKSFRVNPDAASKTFTTNVYEKGHPAASPRSTPARLATALILNASALTLWINRMSAARTKTTAQSCFEWLIVGLLMLGELRFGPCFGGPTFLSSPSFVPVPP